MSKTYPVQEESTKFQVGDSVRIINYGHPISSTLPLDFPVIYSNEGIIIYDMSSDLVGRIGTITKAQKTQGKDQYSLSLVQGKVSWYTNGQLELENSPGFKTVGEEMLKAHKQ